MINVVYTFRTFPYRKEIGANFVFGKMNEDFEVFKASLDAEPDFVVGVALTDGKSRIESRCVNKFGKEKTIIKGGSDEFPLYIPKLDLLPVSHAHTTTFCNWTMYKISQYIQTKKLNTKLIFVHTNKSDILKVTDLIKNLK